MLSGFGPGAVDRGQEASIPPPTAPGNNAKSNITTYLGDCPRLIHGPGNRFSGPCMLNVLPASKNTRSLQALPT
jgi:hypothetical protein